MVEQYIKDTAALFTDYYTKRKKAMKVMEKETFEKMCMEAKTPDDIRKIVKLYEDDMNSRCLIISAKPVYNRYIGWALPTQQVCELVYGFWRLHAECLLVDVGCGSGLFCMMFHAAGIDKQKLLALEKKQPMECYRTENQYWDPILFDDNYEIPIDAIVFIAWGAHAVTERLQSYIRRGGSKVIILGEADITFPCDFFAEDKDWKCELCHVQGPASNVSEYLSFNVRKKI